MTVRPVVFLHGWTMAGDVFADAAARLGEGFACHAPDLPGHGAARGCPAGIERSAEAVAALLDDSDLRDVLLVGWSMGATVAWRYLERFGHARVAGMVSLDMSPWVLNGPDWSLGLMRQGAGGARAKVGWFRDCWPQAAAMIAGGMFAGGGDAPGMTRAEAEARILANDAAVMAGIWASLIEADMREAVRRLPVPMLAIHGAQSRLYPPETAAWLAREAPDARMLCFEHSGHSPHLEEPERFAREIAEFAAGL